MHAASSSCMAHPAASVTTNTGRRQGVAARHPCSRQQARPGQRRAARLVAAAAAQAEAGYRPGPAGSYVLSNGIVDYYELLGVDDIATPQEIKLAYRTLAKVCHVDIAGDTESNRDMCILLNEAYEVLMDAEQRQLYNAELDRALADEDDGYTGEMLSKWMANKKMGKNKDPNESRGAFVDEVTCIGCKQCVWCAPATFRMEDQYGRSRVFAQWLDTEDNIQAAMDACPVSCIHWVQKEDLPALEFVVRNKVKRTNVAAMMSGQGYVDDVWAATTKYLKERKRKEEERERAARVSKAQEAARRAAAQAIMQRQSGWFDSFVTRFGISNMAAAAASALDQSVYGYSSDDEYSGYQRVGRRRRNRQKVEQNYGARNSSGGKVPLERSLVPANNVPLRPWRKDV